MLKFKIDAITLSQNPWERIHWTTRQKQKELWYWLVKSAIGETNPKKKPKHVHIIRVAKRLIDDQNVSAGTKYLVDALQAFGHIYRDSRPWARVTYDQRKVRPGEEPHMEVTITAAEPEEDHAA